MGVVNVTPDSFSDGGLFLDARGGGRARAASWRAEGADILDVGGESTRPGAEPVAAEEELRRVVPVIEGLVAAASRAQISIDTSQGRGRRGGASRPARRIVNDVTALPRRPGDGRRSSPSAALDCCLMHMRGEPRTMQDDPRYDDVVADVKAFLEERLAFAVARGHRGGADLLDPGHRLRQDARAQPRAAAPPRRARRARPAGRGRHLAQVRSSARITGARGATSASPATIATNVLALERGATRLPRPRRRARSRDALAVAAATFRGR